MRKLTSIIRIAAVALMLANIIMFGLLFVGVYTPTKFESAVQLLTLALLFAAFTNVQVKEETSDDENHR